MKALVRHEYGPPDVLRIEEVPKPVPGDHEVLIRVHAASLNLGDWELLTGKPRYIIVLVRILGPEPRYRAERGGTGSRWSRAPRYGILGSDIAGRVEAVGRKVTQFAPGDEVFGDCAVAGFGGFAEYVRVPETAALVPKPSGMTFEQAAAIPQASFIAVRGMRDKGRVRPGSKVLINGAGGGAGSFAVQIARSLGAEVTGVDTGEKAEMMRSLGADHVVDYTREDFTRNGRRYDVILDLAAHRSVFTSRRSLARGGVYLLAGGSGTALAQAAFLGPLISRFGKRKVALLMVDSRREDLALMAELFAAGTVVPAIDSCRPLDEAADAFRRIGEGRSRGKVVLTVPNP